jgi:hypothetical protein
VGVTGQRASLQQLPGLSPPVVSHTSGSSVAPEFSAQLRNSGHAAGVTSLFFKSSSCWKPKWKPNSVCGAATMRPAARLQRSTCHNRDVSQPKTTHASAHSCTEQHAVQHSTLSNLTPTAQHIPSLDPTACTTEIHSQNRTHKAPPTTVPAAHMHKEQLYHDIITAHAKARHKPLHPDQTTLCSSQFHTRLHKAWDTQPGQPIYVAASAVATQL